MSRASRKGSGSNSSTVCTPFWVHLPVSSMSAAHGGHAGGVADGLAGHLLIALLVVAHVVDVVGLFPAVLLAGEDAADVGLAVSAGPRLAGSGSRAFRNLMGTICCPSNSTGVVDSMPTFSRHFMWVR